MKQNGLIIPGGGHFFSRSEIKLAEHLFAQNIKKYFGEVWRIKSDGEYKALDWYCTSPLQFDHGLWLMCQTAKHRGALRAAGRMEVKDSGHKIRFVLLYNPLIKGDKDGVG